MDDDDRIRELAREGIRPWIGADPQGPTWEQLTANTSSRRRPAWAAGALTAAIVLGGIALLPVLMGGTPGAESSTTDAPTTTTAASTTTSTATSTTGATTTTLAPSGLPLETPVPLQLLSTGTTSDGLALLDLQLGRATLHEDVIGQIVGAVYNSQRELILWNSEAVYVFGPDLVEAEQELAPAQPSPTSAMWVVPAADGDSAWIVQSGLEGDPTLLEFRNIENGERLITAEADPGLTPVGATVDGLVFNTADNQVVLFTNSGATLPLGPGRGIATNSTAVVRLVCGDEPTDCEEMFLTSTDGTVDRGITKPDPGIWRPLVGPLPSISPDGTQLLIGFETEAVTVLHVIDLEDGGVQPITELAVGEAVGTWSTDGDWIALVNGVDVDLFSAADPTQTVALRDVIPAGFLPIAAG